MRFYVSCIECRALPPIYCLESEFENVVLNLAIKARDAMLKRGRVTIEAVCGATSNVVIRIHDTDVGIDPRVEAKAFESYLAAKEFAR